MLQIRNISKQYTTGALTQHALNGLSLNFRDSEFVAVLGPSGSGKTTLLNVIGGLDRYDSGDLIINGISTKKYKDRDWDAYRNHTIGFVFQSYNLIPHQSILANVELALTISGVSKRERRKRAKSALEQVGLGDQFHKKPNQMSGGQMQRVAIARALVNNPDILLADEPTGALDSETSVQVLELLKEVAQTRLVVMVTHNSELAHRYATRIVKLRDGKIIGDTYAHPIDNAPAKKAVHKRMGRSAMGFLTSLSLSFNNLRTKKGRTLLTAFAGSIGIIGIALILSLSNGVNVYIEDIQRDTMASYPITIDAQSIDLSSMMEGGGPMGIMYSEADHELDAVYSNSTRLEMANRIATSLTENNLTEFKKYLDDPTAEIRQYFGDSGVLYSYDVPFGVYTRNADSKLIDANSNAFSAGEGASSSSGSMGAVRDNMMGNMSSIMGSAMGGRMFSSEIFDEMLPGSEGSLVSTVTTDSYDLLYGAWPQRYDEVVLVLDEKNELPTTALYALGMLPNAEYDAIMEAIESQEEFEAKTYSYDYADFADQTFYLLPACDYYTQNSNGTFDYAEDKASLEKQMQYAVQLNIAGIIRPAEDAANATLTGAVGYTNALTHYLIDHANNSGVVRAQQSSPEVNVLNGMRFEPSGDAAKIADAGEYLANIGISEKAKLWREMAGVALANDPEQLQAMAALGEAELAAMADAYFADAADEVLLQIYDNYISTGNYDDNMTAFGFVSMDAPSSISIYADTFESKDAIAECIANYNKDTDESNQITYTDFVAIMTASITTIINVISYVLIAFVAVSLVVSSIMIGIITYISVLERTKEIGILRAIGASKRNISQVFNAETFIIGLLAGGLGVGLSYLMLIPGNAVIHTLIGTTSVNAALPLPSAFILIALSVLLTLTGGLIPAKAAARKDPVAALRTE
ncbi:MAG: ATP-binding cassette domain-containing protein [Christensenellales bacterium]|jgi:putative ABC transport system permease protein